MRVDGHLKTASKSLALYLYSEQVSWTRQLALELYHETLRYPHEVLLRMIYVDR